MNNHRSDKVAKARADAGLKRQFQMFRTHHFRDPRHSGSHGYPLWFCCRVIDHVFAHGISDASVHWIVAKKTLEDGLEGLFITINMVTKKKKF